MKIAVALMSLAMAAPMMAQTIPPSETVDAATMRSTGDALLQQAKAAKDGIAFKILFTRPDGNEQLAVRVKSGQGEWHRDYVDVLLVLEGEAQIVTGGEVVNGKETAPGEMRGDSVKGGKVQSFRAGDAIRIEPQVAHQVLMTPGHTLRYFVVKIKTSK